MKTRFRFERLNVWQTARTLNKQVYRLARNLPDYELYAMTSQMRRASVSVSSNIAEGSGRNSDKDFAHFLEQAYGSLMAVASLLSLALDENYVTATEVELVFDGIEKAAGQLAGLNRSLDVKSAKTPFARGAKRGTLDARPSTLD